LVRASGNCSEIGIGGGKEAAASDSLEGSETGAAPGVLAFERGV